MSTTDTDHPLDLREQIVRIDRAITETRKFVAEHDKLAAKARKFDRERALAPWQIGILLVGSVGGFVGGAAGLAAFWHAILR
jgi:hypothetical protein